jgi:hypothetical protein
VFGVLALALDTVDFQEIIYCHIFVFLTCLEC